MADLELQFPRLTESKRKELQEVRRMVVAEEDVRA